MEGNSVIQLIENLIANGNYTVPTKISGEISIADIPGFKTIIWGAIITGIITVITTYIGAKFGSKRALESFKEQVELEQKIKVQEELRINFYSNYEGLYKSFYENFLTLKVKIKVMNGMISSGMNYGINSYTHSINTADDVVNNRNTVMINDAYNSFYSTWESINTLYNYMMSQKIISGFNEFKYKNQYEELSSIKTKFEELDVRARLCERAGGVIQEHIDRYKELSLEIIDLYADGKLNDLSESISNVHEEISKKFIGKYFE